MTKKIFSALISILLIMGLINNVNAAEIKTSLDIVQKASDTKYLENDQGYISKSIVDSNSETGEVTIELKLANVSKETVETEVYENTEIYLMVSENIVNEEEQLNKNIANIRSLVSKIFEYNSNVKIGIIGIKGTVVDFYENEEGKRIDGEKDEGNVNGKAGDTEIVVGLTDNVDTIINGIKNMNSTKTKYRTNLQAAVRLANKSYSEKVNKILISLYDNVPNIAIGVCGQVTYGGNTTYSTVDEAVVAQHEKIATYTRSEMLKLKDSKISFILLRPDDTSYDETWYNVKTGEKILDFDGSPYVKTLYGTIENPTYGKMYNFTNETIDNVITENIYKDVSKIIRADMNNIKIVDYFPKEIVNNFEFSNTNISTGIVEQSINSENNSITWKIENLKGNEIATLRYKLKVKDMKNQELLNKTIATNEKVILTYKTEETEECTVELMSSPQIKLSEIKEEPITPEIPTGNGENGKKDPTVADKPMPNAGKNAIIAFSGIILILASIVIYKKYRNYKEVK